MSVLRSALRRLLVLGSVVLLAAASPPAPPAWLSDVNGEQAMQWVHGENRRSLGILQHDPRYAGFHAQALALAQARDRIPTPEPIGGQIYNFWQDASHIRGIWRRTTLASYRSPQPHWQTVIDLDALARSEHANWVWKGADCAEPQERLCLVRLSDGGEDADTEREYDLQRGKFVAPSAGGFALSRSKQDVDWQDERTLLVARDWGPGTMTDAGYPFVVKRLERGRPTDAAVEVFRGTSHDVGVELETFVDGDANRVSLVERGISFFEKEFVQITRNGTRRLDLPPRATVEGLVDGRLVVRIGQAWTPGSGTPVAAGALVSIDLAQPKRPPDLIFAPSSRQTIDSVGVTGHAVAAAIYDNVRGQGWVFTPPGKSGSAGWSARRLALPGDVSVDVAAASMRDEHAYLAVTGFLDPNTLWLVDAASASASRIKALPAQFDATPYIVEQFEARSSDGTRIPYFVVHRRDMKRDGGNPTELYAYGGFQISITPKYTPVLGKLWLDHGGVYVIANIRGGGEFGPDWHQAALKTNRQRAFDDFAAVGRDLVTRGITSARRLGIRGGSNGGLLMGVEFTQHPELWHAAVIEVPLLDMLHFETMAAGASWVGEYGSVSIPEQRAFLARISPLQNLKAGLGYPEPFIFTTTKDDRVGPVHARRFAWTMQQLQLPFLYFEQTEGGHAAGANLREVATEQALEYIYLSRKLMTGH
nr:prolyl oligopeptidase family serine peptidase [uncultured Lichenicoccus sp.]